jgi:TetR/AcrR family transcriptional regulator, cholesterol catabolism regulator
MDTKTSGKERILDSAARVLRVKGMMATRLSEIAEGAGMLAPSIYHHFKSKDVLVERVMLEGIYRNTRFILSAVETKSAGADPVARLRTGISAHVEFLLSGDDYSSAVARVFPELPEEMRGRVLAAYGAFDNCWRDLIVAAFPQNGKVDPRVARKFLIAMLDSAPMWYRKGKLKPQQIGEQAAELFLRGYLAG